MSQGRESGACSICEPAARATVRDRGVARNWPQKIGDILGHRPMLGSEGASLLGAVLLLRPQLPQPKFLPFRYRGLCHRAAEDDLAGGIQPVAR
jgi:hypothetical protein